ncbi:uncharacterized protein PHACADRAFT_187582 [Phanerochaete carnosa HHB-10118-sp]|uniref:DUF6534 domain-containing protein n=1 Tax=Phanerochaete carnosa (strain HHB-10118-sp) TaxID=650164 RepID=K5VWH9_PHACS|nr:uncharacterized protein PHACADRAFT_187582 [Phanerochaete carnosa HHB-10118-sp]EKM50944.1 hypothetical protein PHACADRAFT_187582 [Phanerochaete carnosa HHB-10118-sp]
MSNASVPLENPIIIDAMPQYGGALIGAIISTALWGISCMQMFMYFLNFDSDRWTVKLFVVYLWIADTVVEIVGFVGLFESLITRWGSIVAFESVVSGLVIRTTLAPLISIPVQMFFLRRIYQFSRNREWIVRIAMIFMVRADCFFDLYMWVHVLNGMYKAILSISQLPLMTGAWTAWVFNSGEDVALTLASHRVVTVEIISRAIPAFVDIFIALWMTILLWRSKERARVFRRSNRLILRLILLTINAGIWTALFSIIDLGLIAWNPSKLMMDAFDFPLSPLYFNMLLASLNARRFLRRDTGSIGKVRVETLELDTLQRPAGLHFSRSSDNPALSGDKNPVLAIRIDKSMATHRDRDMDMDHDTKV